MIFFRNDYSEGAHPKVMEALNTTNMKQTLGYGEDEYCAAAAEMIKNIIQRNDAEVHFLMAGTQTNFTAISAFLRPHEAVIAPARGHICVHETGAIEATGHKIVAMPTDDAKLRAEQIDEAVLFHCDEHMVKPKMVYITNTTELGTIYTKTELLEIRERCDKYGLYLYMDGARLASALTCEENDLTLQDIAKLVDAFYIGGTKNGALFGEALVLLNKELMPEFRYILKQKGGMLAKGRLLGVQFEALFKDNLYYDLAAHANKMAKQLREGISALGYSFIVDSPTNQIFPIFPNNMVAKLEEQCTFELERAMDETHTCIRFVTSWATPEEDVYKILQLIKELQ